MARHTYIGINDEGIYKIGSSIDLVQREKSIARVHCGFKILFAKHENIEPCLHMELKHLRVTKGVEIEWYALSEKDVRLIVSSNGFVEFHGSDYLSGRGCLYRRRTDGGFWSDTKFTRKR